MKLPEKIKGRNRIRDGAIVLYFKRDSMDYPDLAERFKLTERRILQILSKNHAFIKIDKDWEKQKRINRLNRWLRDKPKTSRDPLEIQSELRKEVEGDKPVIDNSTHHHYTLIQKLHERSRDPADTIRVD